MNESNYWMKSKPWSNIFLPNSEFDISFFLHWDWWYTIHIVSSLASNDFCWLFCSIFCSNIYDHYFIHRLMRAKRLKVRYLYWKRLKLLRGGIQLKIIMMSRLLVTFVWRKGKMFTTSLQIHRNVLTVGWKVKFYVSCHCVFKGDFKEPYSLINLYWWTSL